MIMTVFDLDDRNRAYVSEQEFMDYLAKTARRDDYTRVVDKECIVGDKNWQVCECLNYYNSAGCLLALYNRDYEYGEIF